MRKYQRFEQTSRLTIGSSVKPCLPFSHYLLHVASECHQIDYLAVEFGQLLKRLGMDLPARGSPAITCRQDFR